MSRPAPRATALATRPERKCVDNSTCVLLLRWSRLSQGNKPLAGVFPSAQLDARVSLNPAPSTVQLSDHCVAIRPDCFAQSSSLWSRLLGNCHLRQVGPKRREACGTG